MLLKNLAVLKRATRPVIERLEDRRLLAANLTLTNLDALPSNDRLIFNRIQTPDTNLANVVHDTATVRLGNDGDETLTLSSVTLNGPWEFVSPPSANFAGVTIAPGAFQDVTVRFIEDSLPAHSYNQTNYTTNPNGGATVTGALTINSNDPTDPNEVVTLAGYWQSRSENNAEPGLQTIVNLINGYQTNIAPTPTVDLTQDLDERRIYGEEVTHHDEDNISLNWAVANPSQPVTIRQIAAFHTQGNVIRTFWYNAGSQVSHLLYSSQAAEGQTLLPHRQGSTTTPLSASFNPTGDFGFRVDNEYSDDQINLDKDNTAGGGHHMRFYPLRDGQGNIVANTYILAMDYAVIQTINFDFNDNVYIVSNVRPADRPPTPTNLASTSTPTTVNLTWNPVNYSALAGYNIYRSDSFNGTYTKLNGSPITGTNYTDNTTTTGVTLYYRIHAVDNSGAAVESIGSSITAATASGVVANPDNFFANAGVATTVNVVANDDGAIVPQSVIIVSNPSNGTAVVDASTGLVTYTANGGFAGTDTFSYTVKDISNNTSAAATVTMTVSDPALAAPFGTNDSAKTLAGAPIVINVLGNDTAGAGFNLGTMVIDPSAQPQRGTATVNADGTITYTPGANFAGSDTFRYRILDNNGVEVENELDANPLVTVNVGVEIGSGSGRQRKLVYSVPDTEEGPSTQATVTLNRGVAAIYFTGNGTVSTSGTTTSISGGNLRINQISLTGTSSSSTLKITSNGGPDPIAVDGIVSTTRIGSIDARVADLNGDMNVAGLRTLRLENINNSDMIIGNNGTSSLTMTVTGNVMDSTLTALNRISRLQVASWQNTVGGNQTISAPRLTTLRVTGDFEPSLNLGSESSASTSTLLSSARVDGHVGEGFWDVNGRAGTIRIGSIITGWGGEIDGTLSSFTVNAAGMPADVHANKITSMTVNGDLTGTVRSNTSLSRLTVNGNVNGGTIDVPSGNITTLRVNGNFAGTVAAKKVTTFRVTGNMDDSTVSLSGPASGSTALTSFRVDGNIDDSTISANGNISSFRAASLIDSIVAAGVDPTLDDVNLTSIGTRRISDLRLTGTTAPTFSNSEILAQQVTSARLGTVDTSQSGGIVTDILRSLRFQIGDTPFSAGSSDLADQAAFDAFVAEQGIVLGQFSVAIL